MVDMKIASLNTEAIEKNKKKLMRFEVYSNYKGKILELPKRCQDQGLIKWITITITTYMGAHHRDWTSVGMMTIVVWHE